MSRVHIVVCTLGIALLSGCAPSQSSSTASAERDAWANRLAAAEELSKVQAEQAKAQHKARAEQAAIRGARSDEQVVWEAMGLEKELCAKALLQWQLVKSSSKLIDRLPEGTPGESMDTCKVSQERANAPISDPDQFIVAATFFYPKRYGEPERFLMIVRYEKGLDPTYELKLKGAALAKMDSR